MAYNEGLSPDAIRQLFGICDLNGNGYIERNELAAVCTDLDPEELTGVFKVCLITLRSLHHCACC